MEQDAMLEDDLDERDGQRSPAGLGTGNGAGVGSVAASPR
jgi:hypothetical protein